MTLIPPLKSKDTVNIDYVGKIDDVAFDGGSTDGNGTDLVLGSGSYIDNFEEQLIGAHPGDKVEVKVTFPDDYRQQILQVKKQYLMLLLTESMNNQIR